jgi:hypothetical protein
LAVKTFAHSSWNQAIAGAKSIALTETVPDGVLHPPNCPAAFGTNVPKVSSTQQVVAIELAENFFVGPVHAMRLLAASPWP